MSITIQCPQCRTRFRCKDYLAGKQATCLICHTLLTVPENTVEEEKQELPQPAEIEFKPEATVWDAPWHPPQWESGLVSHNSKVKDSSTATHPLQKTAEIPHQQPDPAACHSPGPGFHSGLLLSIVVISVLILLIFIRLFL
ncbi:MAG: hypothetical protein KDA77_00470 [Planctomycetaceae bacterium]|nr:hypothetical protein [Planctomycetaceae bacterium]